MQRPGSSTYTTSTEAALHRAMQGSADSEYTYDWRSTWGPESRPRNPRCTGQCEFYAGHLHPSWTADTEDLAGHENKAANII